MTDSPQSKGGKSRAEKLSADERREIARQGAQKRWAKLKDLPQATHGSADQPLKIGDAEIQCYVLADGRRVISQRGMNAALQRAESGSISRRKPVYDAVGNLPSFLYPSNIRSFISNDLALSATTPIEFKLPGGNTVGHGYPAEMLPEVCSVWMQAKEAGVLTPAQMKTAAAASIIVQAMAKVGIVALVDEATGYQSERERGELHRLLEAYLSEERLAWAKRFPDEFYKQIYRLKDWTWPPNGRAKPPVLGHITNDIVYERLPTGVLPKLRELNPADEESKRRKFKHHQFLSPEVGQPDLRDHILQILPLMKVSKTWDGFKKLLEQAFPKSGDQGRLDL
ncbi:P63C domain-containing protein [Asticcacaulis excentricus]|uniref:P63C domain-containing protein n=1 Tax=Asticcacaulis excentricus TaxID=78587 RepID=UPI001562ABE1|nr:P63C domain-containing protein [Asticcacaulis excentricus]